MSRDPDVRCLRGLGPSTSIAIILGASRFPNNQELDSAVLAAAFSGSKNAMLDYLTSVCGEVLDAFDSQDFPSETGLNISRFLSARKHATDVIFYYVGHGGYFRTQEYYVALRCTSAEDLHHTTLRLSDLGSTLVHKTGPRTRCFLILDCCFAAGAVPFLMQGQHDIALLAAQARLLPHGVALLAAASREKAAKVPEGAELTMFSGALLSILNHGTGASSYGAQLSLHEVGDLCARALDDHYREESVRPQVHSPIQRDGDPASYPFFPNRARAASEQVREASAVPETTPPPQEIDPLEVKLKELFDLLPAERISELTERAEASISSDVTGWLQQRQSTDEQCAALISAARRSLSQARGQRDKFRRMLAVAHRAADTQPLRDWLTHLDPRTSKGNRRLLAMVSLRQSVRSLARSLAVPVPLTDFMSALALDIEEARRAKLALDEQYKQVLRDFDEALCICFSTKHQLGRLHQCLAQRADAPKQNIAHAIATLDDRLSLLVLCTDELGSLAEGVRSARASQSELLHQLGSIASALLLRCRELLELAHAPVPSRSAAPHSFRDRVANLLDELSAHVAATETAFSEYGAGHATGHFESQARA